MLRVNMTGCRSEWVKMWRFPNSPFPLKLKTTRTETRGYESTCSFARRVYFHFRKFNHWTCERSRC